MRARAWTWTCVAVGLGLAGLVVASCGPTLPSFYGCQRDSQCVSHGVAGFCELPVGACSFSDATCPPPARRYGGLDTPGLAGQCVTAGNVNGSDGGSPSDGGSDGGSVDMARGSSGGNISRPGASSLAAGNHGATVTLMKPSQVSAGDLLLVSVFADLDTVTISAPTGWQVSADLTGGVSGSTSVFHAGWFFHFAGASEPASYDFQLSAAVDTSAGGLVDYRGVADPPIDVGATQLFEAAKFIAPSITTTHPKDYLVAMFVDGASMSGITWTAPGGMNSAVNTSIVGMFDQAQAVAGASGTREAAAGIAVPGIGAVDFVALTAAP